MNAAGSMPRRLALAATSGALLTLAYPPFALSAVGWLALTPLLLALDGARPRAAMVLGWIFGSVLGLGVAGYWLWHAAVDYFGLTPLPGALFTVGLVELFVAPFTALFGVLVALGPRGAARLVYVPAAFVVGEYARATLAGNGWELLGHSQRALPLLQIVDVTGVYGLSFLLALGAVAAAEAVRATARRDRRPIAAAVLTMAALALALGYGSWRLAHLPPAHGTLRTLLVQGNVSNADRAQPGRVGAVLQRYLALSASPPPAAELIVWPENAIAVFPEDNTALLAPVHAFLAQASAVLLSGAPRAGARADVAAIYNSLYLITADGLFSAYDKRRLLPFVERLPLRTTDGPYLPGHESAPFTIGGARIGALICYEVIYPDLARALVARGAELLVNVSNDSWFDAGAGPAQHHELARFRAIESRVALVRVTNSGVSSVFDASGQDIARLPVGVATAAAVDVPLVAGGSFYTRHGDWFAWLCLAVVVGGVVAGLRARTRSTS